MADITKGVRAFTVGTAISRVFGLIRESVFAYLYGAGRSTDAFVAAFRIPNLLRDLFAETALSAAFVPVLTAERQKSKEQQNLLASNVFNILLITVGAIVLLGIICAPYLVKIIAFGFGNIPDKQALTTRLAIIMFPFLLFVALAAWAMGYLNTEREFFTPSVAPAFLNIVSIAVPLLSFAYFVRTGTDPIYAMAYGILIGGLMQFLVQVPVLFAKGFHYRLYINFRDPTLRRILILFVPVALGLAASRINVAVDTFLISFLEERSMTWLNYAFRIMHLPLGLFGIAVGTVALPAISQHVAEKKFDAARSTLFDSLQLVFFLTVTTSVIIAVLAHPITRLIYERGHFTPFDTHATTQALILYIIGVPFIAGIRNVAAVFYAYHDAKTPMYASFIAVGLHVILSLGLMRIIGFRAFPLATTVSSFVNLAILMHRLPEKIGHYEISPLVDYFTRLVIASIIGGFVGILFNRILTNILGTALLSQVLNLGLSGAAAVVTCYIASILMGVTEVKEYVKRLFHRQK
ncbi:MAG: murein biosynthesis integral membrane protein MurJ [candidate division WOR-3 bacterium]|nr:MAG: murein biosynthesis integral membrane protein MurJ [candidate division WOR-3 bacterium]